MVDGSDQFHLHIHLKLILGVIGFVFPLVSLDVDEVAPLPVDAEVMVFKTATFLCFVFWVHLVVFSELGESVSKFAFFIVGAVSMFHKFFAKLWFKFGGFGINGFFEFVLSGVGVAFFVASMMCVFGVVVVGLSGEHEWCFSYKLNIFY